MSGSGPDDDAKLVALDSFIVEQILNASEAEMLDQAEPGDVERVDEAFRRAKLGAGKARMASARGAVVASRTGTVTPFDPARARQRLDAMVASQGEHGKRLTLAARGATGDIDGDGEGILEDLSELLDEEDGKGSP